MLLEELVLSCFLKKIAHNEDVKAWNILQDMKICKNQLKPCFMIRIEMLEHFKSYLMNWQACFSYILIMSKIPKNIAVLNADCLLGCSSLLADCTFICHPIEKSNCQCVDMIQMLNLAPFFIEREENAERN